MSRSPQNSEGVGYFDVRSEWAWAFNARGLGMIPQSSFSTAYLVDNPTQNLLTYRAPSGMILIKDRLDCSFHYLRQTLKCELVDMISN